MSTRMKCTRVAAAILGLSLSIYLVGCGKEEPADQAGVEVTVVKVTPQDIPVSIEFVGKTQSSRRVEIRSRVEGFLEKRLYTEGTLVQEGQALFQMDQKPFQAQLDAAKAELAQQKARLRTATANLKRVKPLAAQNALPQKELDDAEGSYRSARAAVEAAQAKVVQAELNLGYTTIISPVTGLSSFANQREGAYIGIGTESLLTYVAQLDPMWVEFSVSENQILRKRKDMEAGLITLPENALPGEADFVVEIVLADGSTYPHTGRITFADAALSEETGTFLIRAELPNPEMELRPGQFVRTFLRGAIRPSAIVLPQRAVQQGARGSFVWVVNEKGQAEFRPVKLGPWHGEQWFIEEGLQADETVVVDGTLRLRAGAPVKIVVPKSETDNGTATPQQTDAG